MVYDKAKHVSVDLTQRHIFILIKVILRPGGLEQGKMGERMDCRAKYARGSVNWAIKMTLKTSALPPSLSPSLAAAG